MANGVFLLDFDGPLFPKKCLTLKHNLSHEAKFMCKKLNLYNMITYWKMDSFAVEILNEIYENYYPFEAVISSSWSHPRMHNQNQIKDLMNTNGIKCNLHNDWRTNKDPKTRVEQISQWLISNKQIDKYIILDDAESAPEMQSKDILLSMNINPKFVFMVDINDGITLKDYNNICNIVKKW